MRFRAEFFFLSNFYPCELESWGLTFSCAEALYVACKTTDFEKRKEISQKAKNGAEAKRMGRTLVVREDWLDIRIEVMRRILSKKFKHNEHLAEKLKTLDIRIVETNYWHDNFWGSCGCEACEEKTKHNHLGRLLMELRDELNGHRT